MYVPINPLGYSCIKKLQRDNLLHAYNEPINIYSEGSQELNQFSVVSGITNMTLEAVNLLVKLDTLFSFKSNN